MRGEILLHLWNAHAPELLQAREGAGQGRHLGAALAHAVLLLQARRVRRMGGRAVAVTVARVPALLRLVLQLLRLHAAVPRCPSVERRSQPGGGRPVAGRRRRRPWRALAVVRVGLQVARWVGVLLLLLLLRLSVVGWLRPGSGRGIHPWIRSARCAGACANGGRAADEVVHNILYCRGEGCRGAVSGRGRVQGPGREALNWARTNAAHEVGRAPTAELRGA